jgi:thiol-disulfide isomerase/thioredoxin
LLILTVGCASATKNRTLGGDTLPPRDLPTTAPPERDGAKGNLAVGQLGMLAGQVLDGERRVANASIRVIELDRDKPRAPLLVRTDANGWFDIPGLEKGQRYQLVASVNRGGVLYSGQVNVVASDVRIAIPLVEVRNGVSASDTVSGDRPAASLGTPTKSDPSPSSKPVLIDPTRTAEGKPKNDWDHQPRPPTISVPGVPGRDAGDTPQRTPLPPPPGMDTPEEGTTRPLNDKAKGVPEEDSDRPPSMGYSSRVPLRQRDSFGEKRETPTVQVVPACVRHGLTVAELALYDRDGRPWELSRQTQGKFVLLDFWRADCPPCRAAMPHLAALQSKHGESGLQVVGVLCDGGSVASRRDRLKKFEERQAFRYPVLFSEPGECPVRLQLNVRRYPTLVLLDDTGRIVWSKEGYDASTASELDKAIAKLTEARNRP